MRIPLPPEEAAIDDDGAARHIIRQIGHQELDHLSAVLNRALPPQRNPLGLVRPVPQPPGADDAGGDGVDVDVIRAKFLGQGPGVVNDRGFGRAVDDTCRLHQARQWRIR